LKMAIGVMLTNIRAKLRIFLSCTQVNFARVGKLECCRGA
jgi:hypothetical protein